MAGGRRPISIFLFGKLGLGSPFLSGFVSFFRGTTCKLLISCGFFLLTRSTT